MTEELDKKLCAKYPKIFADRNADMKDTCLCWGFEHGDGWYWLLDRLCKKLQWDIDNNGDPQIKAAQVKEKFGGLCFYIDGGTVEQHAQISLAESMSGGICEYCGSTKEIGHTGGWIKTLCKTCGEKIEKSNWKLAGSD